MRLVWSAAVVIGLWSWGNLATAQEMSSDPAAAAPGSYRLDKAHASVTLKVAHLGLSYVTMRFDQIDASYVYDPANPAASKINVSIKPGSIDTGDAAFNGVIAEQMFETAKFPSLTFVSTAVHTGSGGKGEVVGNLTFHGITHPVTLDVVFNGAGLGPEHEQRMGFSALTTIKRSDFGVAKYIGPVGDDVTVLIETEFVKQP